MVADGQRLVYTPGDLSAYRTRDLPSTYLTKLNTGFANLRKQGLKAVVRFAYNYPETESDYLNAQDATLSRVKRHHPAAAGAAGQCGCDCRSAGRLHRGLGRVAYLVQQAHHPGQQGGRARCVAAGRARQPPAAGALPRRSGGVVPTPPTLEQLLAPSPTAAARIGQHNDCFLASPDDVGTYWASTPQQSAALRTYAQQASATTGAGAKPVPHRGGPGPHDL